MSAVPKWDPDRELWDLIERADEIGIRLEIVGGTYSWEVSPGFRHQDEIFRIQNSIKAKESDCSRTCTQCSDVPILFKDGSVKRPDVAVYCERPPDHDEFVRMIPEATIEVVSKRFEKKDYEVGVPFYLSQGVKDVIVFDPRTKSVLHVRENERKELKSPVQIDLLCGCTCVV